MRRGQAGFTLVELMVALVVSTILVALVLAIFTRMSMAYRSQQQVSELQQVLQAAQYTAQHDLRQAGDQMAQGFRWAGDPNTVPAVRITNRSDGPDELAIFYADTTAQARMVGAPGLTANVDDASQFLAGDVVVVVANDGNVTNPHQTNPDGTDAEGTKWATIAKYVSCVRQIEDITGVTITFTSNAPWGDGTNSITCDTAWADRSMIYRLVARAYRIDPARRELGVLQMSPTGGLIANDWQDLGIGFTDFQVASRWYELAQSAARVGIDTPDPDADPVKDWYSGDDQTALTQSYDRNDPANMPYERLLEVSLTFVVRTQQAVEGIASSRTPDLIGTADPAFNQVTDHPSFVVEGVPDALRPVELRGNNIYRYSTAAVDVRNTGVGL